MTRRGRAILLAVLLDAALGDPPILHPVAGFGRAAAGLERWSWAPSRPRGVVHIAALVAAATMIGGHARRHLAVEAVALWAALGGRSLATSASRLADLVEAGESEQARALAPTLMGRDPRTLDGCELCRGAVESVAENTADAVVAALCWHVLLGPAGSCAYRAANTLDAMIGHRSARYEQLGWAAARLDDLMTWPAARAATALAIVLSGRVADSWRAVRRHGRAHPSPNAGLLESAFAGALGVRLGGSVRYGDRTEHRPILGQGERPSPADVRRAIRLSQRICFASSALAVLAAEGLAR